jgi:type I restriction enzyme S subunit
MPRVILDTFWAHEIPAPPLSEQRRIVEILDQADRLRRLRAEADAKAERILSALFSKIFSRATNFGQLVCLGDLVEIGTSLVDPAGPEYQQLPHVGGENIEKDTGRLVDLKTVSASNLRSAKFYFTDQHVLYSKIRPYLNKVAYPQFAGVCSADIYPLLPKDDRIGPWFLTAVLRSPEFLAYARSQSDRLRMPKLNREQLAAYQVRTSLVDTVALFEKQAGQLAELEVPRLKAGEGIDLLFRSVLESAFSGRLTASWREANKEKLRAEARVQVA